MRFYRVTVYVEGGQSGGFEWFTTRRDAEKCAAEISADERDDDPEKNPPPEVALIEIAPTKAGILTALRRYADHPDNG